MKKIELDKYEQEIEDTILEYRTVSDKNRRRIKNIIKAINEKQNISTEPNSFVVWSEEPNHINIDAGMI
jgi:hypothetical protein